MLVVLVVLVALGGAGGTSGAGGAAAGVAGVIGVVGGGGCNGVGAAWSVCGAGSRLVAAVCGGPLWLVWFALEAAGKPGESQIVTARASFVASGRRCCSMSVVRLRSRQRYRSVVCIPVNSGMANVMAKPRFVPWLQVRACATTIHTGWVVVMV